MKFSDPRDAPGVFREGQSSNQSKAALAERLIRCLTSLQMRRPPSVSRTWRPDLSQIITTALVFHNHVTSGPLCFAFFPIGFTNLEPGIPPALLSEQPLQYWENPTRACIHRAVILKRLKFPIWMNYPFKRYPERCSADYTAAEYQSMTLCKPAGSHSVQR